MGPHKEREKELSRHSKDKKLLTIMIFKEVGKVRRFVISSRLVLLVSLFLLFYIVATIYITNKFFDIYGENKILADENAELSRELIKTKKSLERSEQHVALLDDYLNEGKELSQEPEPPVDYTESPSPKIVDIDEIKVKRDISMINVTFRIVNRQSNEEPIGGYIFVLASPKDSDQSEVWVYPSSPLKDGLPVNYRKGLRFLIQRFKTIRSQYTLSRSINEPIVLRILVYNRDGLLILKKVVEV
jgi:hypothetical protein